MSDDKYTKGPWKAHKTSLARSGVPEFEIHWSPDGECVAEVVHGEDCAHLIEAAPELRDAAKSARAALAVAIRSAWEGATDEDVDESLIIKKLDAAIGKATGGAQ